MKKAKKFLSTWWTLSQSWQQKYFWSRGPIQEKAVSVSRDFISKSMSWTLKNREHSFFNGS